MGSSQIQRPIGFKPSEISSMVNEDVITQHAENASFLWMQRDRAVYAPHYKLKDLADLDERVEANIDGLCIAGRVGWRICEQALDNNGPGDVFAAGVLAFESRDQERIKKILDIGTSAPELERALISALGWIPLNQIEDTIKDLLQSVNAQIRRVGIGACAVHRKDPGSPLIQAILDQNSRLRNRALKAAGELGRTDLLPTIIQTYVQQYVQQQQPLQSPIQPYIQSSTAPSCSEDDDGCHFFAAWSSARLGNRTGQVIDTLKRITEKRITEKSGLYAERAMDIALRCMDVSQAKDWLQKLRSNPDQLRLSIVGAGVVGAPELINYLILDMENAKVARVAGEAFSMITGIDLAYDDLEHDKPEGFESGPTEEPEDEDVALDKDEDLPWPAPDLIKDWWDKNKKNFHEGRRYLRGKEITKDSLRDTLKQGTQRQRTAAALELGLMEPNRPLFEVRAPGKRQMKEMAL